MIAWYTTAWFDKYLRHDPSADNMLLTERWRDDPIEASIDPNHDGNAFSFHYYSRLDIHLANGQVWDCEDLRGGCPGIVPDSQDGFLGTYSDLAVDTSPDSVTGPGASLESTSSLTPCVAGRAIVFRLARFHGKPITRVEVYVGKRLVMTRRGRFCVQFAWPACRGAGSTRSVWSSSPDPGARVVTRTMRTVRTVRVVSAPCAAAASWRPA